MSRKKLQISAREIELLADDLRDISVDLNRINSMVVMVRDKLQMESDGMMNDSLNVLGVVETFIEESNEQVTLAADRLASAVVSSLPEKEHCFLISNGEDCTWNGEIFVEGDKEAWTTYPTKEEAIEDAERLIARIGDSKIRVIDGDSGDSVWVHDLTSS